MTGDMRKVVVTREAASSSSAIVPPVMIAFARVCIWERRKSSEFYTKFFHLCIVLLSHTRITSQYLPSWVGGCILVRLIVL